MNQRSGLREKLTYSNVMVTLLAVVVLGGGIASAAGGLGKNSVGPKQLKKNSVTTAKIKKNAVTAAKIKKNAVTKAKIKNGSVNGAKIADGSVTGTEINAATTPFGRIVYEARGNSVVPIEDGGAYLLPNGTYTQEAGRDDTYLGALDLTFKPSCEPPRTAVGYALIDAPNPAKPEEASVAAIGAVSDTSGGTATKRINLGTYFGASFQRDAPTNHTLSLFVELGCKSGEGATVTFGAVDVIGVK
jgi:hypothetical protein